MQMIRKSGKPALVFHDLPASQTQSRSDRGTGGGDFPQALRSGAGSALSGGGLPALGGRSRAGVRDPSCDRRRLDARRFRAGSVHGISPGCEGHRRPRFRRCRSPTRNGARPSGRSGSPPNWRNAAGIGKPILRTAPRLWSPPSDHEAASGRVAAPCHTCAARAWRAVRDLARRNGATLFSTLLTIFQITLSKWTGADDIVVGTPVANRNKQNGARDHGLLLGHRAAARPDRSGSDRSPTASRRCI